ncbi:MAG: hypothetical protein Q3968_03850 [Clostridiaceae bacterium]|nr:hypothetical protein [Clostridiaceae bacterium]
MKKALSLLAAVLLIAILSVNAFALKIDPNLTVKVKSSGIPEGTVYVDVLLPKEAFGERFVEFNENCSIDSCYRYYAGLSQEPFEKIELLADDEIAQYRLDDYYSILAHFDGAGTEFGTEQFNSYHDYYYGSDKEFDCTAYFFVKSQDGETADSLDILQSAKKIKLAYIGADGNILLISEPFSVKDRAVIAAFFYNAVADGEKVKAKYYISPFNIAFNLIVVSAVVVITVVIVRKIKDKKQFDEPVEKASDGQN